jgi:hypothetical protein
MDQHRGHRLRSGEEVERRLRRGRNELDARRLARAIATRVTNRAIEDHFSAAANAETERRVKARLVEVDDGRPNRLDRLRAKSNRERLDLGWVTGSHLVGLEDPDPLRPEPPDLPPLHPTHPHQSSLGIRG